MTNNPSQDMDRGLYLINSPTQLVVPQREWTGLNDLNTARDALEPLPPVVWLVDQIIQPASLSVFFGDPGSKKTFSLIDLGTHVASGKDWLGMKVSKENVLYIDEDMGEYGLHSRIGNNLRANNYDGETPINWKSMAGLDLGNGGHLNQLERSIIEKPFSLVIIDAFADVIPGKDENAVKDINPILIGLKRIANETNCAFIIIHHSNKTGGYRGSTAISAAIDLLVHVKSDEKLNRITFKSEKFRYGKPFEFSATFESSDDKFRLVQNTEQQGESRRVIGKAQRSIINYLFKNGPSFTNEILANNNGATPNAIRQAIPKLIKNGYIHRVNEGGKGVEAEYDLTEKGKELFPGR
jgi:DNA-binding HxlR family transcriptional regulator